MKQISTVEFRKNIYKYLPELPIAVVAKGKIQFFVVDRLEGEQVVQSVVTVPEKPKEVLKTETYTEKHRKGEKSGDYTWEWCQANKSHPFEAGKLYECLKVTFVDGDGNDAYYEGKYWNGKWICKDCLEKMNESIPDGMGFREGGGEDV